MTEIDCFIEFQNSEPFMITIDKDVNYQTFDKEIKKRLSQNPDDKFLYSYQRNGEFFIKNEEDLRNAFSYAESFGEDFLFVINVKEDKKQPINEASPILLDKNNENKADESKEEVKEENKEEKKDEKKENNIFDLISKQLSEQLPGLAPILQSQSIGNIINNVFANEELNEGVSKILNKVLESPALNDPAKNIPIFSFIPPPPPQPPVNPIINSQPRAVPPPIAPIPPPAPSVVPSPDPIASIPFLSFVPPRAPERLSPKNPFYKSKENFRSQCHSAVCDHCSIPINGNRYKCLTCPDFDLCDTCEVNSPEYHNPLHVFAKIRNVNQTIPTPSVRPPPPRCPSRTRPQSHPFFQHVAPSRPQPHIHFSAQPHLIPSPQWVRPSHGKPHAPVDDRVKTLEDKIALLERSVASLKTSFAKENNAKHRRRDVPEQFVNLFDYNYYDDDDDDDDQIFEIKVNKRW